MTTLHEEIERAELQMSWGEGRAPCALCGQIRPMADLTPWHYRDDHFMLCSSAGDVIPTCYERYAAGRKKWNVAHG